MKRADELSISAQIKSKLQNPKSYKKPEYDGNTETMISTGSTLLDLAISGGRVKGGGIPGGILVEIFGPAGSGKTVLLCEIAGNVQSYGGEVVFNDPESRLNKQFAKLFGLNVDDMKYSNPDTVPEVFKAVRDWKPKNIKIINGIFADSLAALSTDLEMDNKEGDKMGTRRAKEFSEELRKTCRILVKNNYLMACSNQVRQNLEPFGQKYISPGGESISFYSSLRLRTMKPEKIKKEAAVAGKKITRVIGVNINVEVFKSSVWNPYHVVPLTILFDYGIDDIRQNLQFIKDYTRNNTYTVLGRNLDNSLEKSIKIIEDENLENKLRFETIELWESIENKFESNRKLKQ